MITRRKSAHVLTEKVRWREYWQQWQLEGRRVRRDVSYLVMSETSRHQDVDILPELLQIEI